LRGDGVFEVIRVYDGLPFAMEDHLARLQRSAANLKLPIDVEAVRADAHRLLAQAGAGPDHEALRIALTRGGRRLLLTEPLPPTTDSVRLASVTYSPTRLLDAVKSLSYAHNWPSRSRASRASMSAARHAARRVLEAPTSSIFWVSGEELLTPPLDDHILASITRARVIELTGASERPARSRTCRR